MKNCNFMSNPFKKMLHHYEVPKILRQKILSDVYLLKIKNDITDLFLLKYPKNNND